MPKNTGMLASKKRESRPAVAGRLPECLLPRDTREHSKISAKPQFRILVRPEAFGCGFDVLIDPALPDQDVGREIQNHAHAMAFARVLRLEFGFPIVDHTGELS